MNYVILLATDQENPKPFWSTNKKTEDQYFEEGNEVIFHGTPAECKWHCIKSRMHSNYAGVLKAYYYSEGKTRQILSELIENWKD